VLAISSLVVSALPAGSNAPRAGVGLDATCQADSAHINAAKAGATSQRKLDGLRAGGAGSPADRTARMIEA